MWHTCDVYVICMQNECNKYKLNNKYRLNNEYRLNKKYRRNNRYILGLR